MDPNEERKQPFGSEIASDLRRANWPVIGAVFAGVNVILTLVLLVQLAAVSADVRTAANEASVTAAAPACATVYDLEYRLDDIAKKIESLRTP